MNVAPQYKLRDMLVSAAAFVVIVAGMRAAAPFLTPLLLAIFIAIIVTPLFFGLQRLGMRSGIALLVLVMALALILMLGTTVLLGSINAFSENLADYQAALKSQLTAPLQWLAEKGIDAGDEFAEEYLTGRTALNVMKGTLGALTAILSQTFIVLLIVVFLLLEAALLPGKLRAAPGISVDTRDRLSQAVDSVRQYMGMKALLSLATGLLVWITALVLGIDYPVLLGVLAFLLNFIPNIGSIMAAIPGVLLALVEFGPARAGGVAAVYLMINVCIGNFLEPRIMGKGLGLSPMIIVVSLLLWGWVLGPIGMLLSVPLTMTVKVFMASLDETRGIAILMGSVVPEELRNDSAMGSGHPESLDLSEPGDQVDNG
ncbi:MAG: AI-2E family transporter [Kiritimatiellae bacterium]|nr:AI-2E family transporter [Kiritimatiellia bacterium]